MRRTARTLVLVAAAAVAAAAIAPSAWVDVKRMMRDHLDALALAAEHAADWVGGGTVRDTLAQGSAGATISGPARVSENPRTLISLSMR